MRVGDAVDVGGVEAEADDIWHDDRGCFPSLATASPGCKLRRGAGPGLPCARAAGARTSSLRGRGRSAAPAAIATLPGPTSRGRSARTRRTSNAPIRSTARRSSSAAPAIRRGGDAPLAHADIIVSDDPATVLSIQTADCVPLLIADRRTGAVAAAHAGWRGLAARVPAVAVAGARGVRQPAGGSGCGDRPVDQRPALEWKSAPRCARDSSRTGFQRLSAIAGSLAAARPDHWFFDGWASARDQLSAAGVPARTRFISPACARPAIPDLFCSYRRDGKAAGRIAAAIRAFAAPSIAAFASRSACAFLRAPDVLEVHVAELVREQPRFGVQRLEAGVLHLVVAEHLLHEQQRIGAHVQLALAVAGAPTRAPRSARGTRRRCWWRRRSTRRIPRPARRPAARCGRRSRRARDFRARRRRCRRRPSGRRGGVEWQPRVRGLTRGSLELCQGLP